MTMLKSNSRVLICGKTGSGKTYLVKTLVPKYPRVLFFDPKCENSDIKGFKTSSLREVKYQMNQKKFTIIYQPENFDRDLWNQLCGLVFSSGNMTLIMDETERLVTPRVESNHEKIIRMGRSRGIGVIHLVQRPTYLDNYILSEAEFYFVFQLNLESDKKKIKGVIGDFDALDNIPQYHYMFYDVIENKPRICKPIK
ncbi:MAG: hypothetical protein ABIJ18_05785 [archaeon]